VKVQDPCFLCWLHPFHLFHSKSDRGEEDCTSFSSVPLGTPTIITAIGNPQGGTFSLASSSLGTTGGSFTAISNGSTVINFTLVGTTSPGTATISIEPVKDHR
jgi:hypothetical protein